MNFLTMLQLILGLIAGGLIGASFGLIQNAARRRNEKRQQTGNFNNAWAAMPGAGGRVVFLMVALILVQLICPLLFKDNLKWWVSAGVAGGYGLMLFWQLRQRLSQNK
ncbi:MAG TPA: hypothetical protein VKA67_01290 [Verrucomicrobiae bacterium]|nr:hypothetical protein [Verrucomicrobiae bacterium]